MNYLVKIHLYNTMLDLISFLTQIPVTKGTKIEEVAARSYLFPFAALIIHIGNTKDNVNN